MAKEDQERSQRRKTPELLAAEVISNFSRSTCGPSQSTDREPDPVWYAGMHRSVLTATQSIAVRWSDVHAERKVER